MARIIEARVRQKASTLEEWNNSDLESLDGEQLFVRSDVDDKVIGFKLGAKGKKFSELDYPDFTVRGKVSPTSTWAGRQSGVYIPTSNGVYNGIEVNLADGYQVLYWDGETLEKVVYPVDYSGAVFGGAIDDSKDLSTPPTEPTWYIASPGDYNTTPPITLTENSILSWDGNEWSHIPFELEVRGEFLVADNIAEVRNITPEVAQLLVNGTYKGVEVLGYYEKGDTPAPIIYYLSDTTEEDDGGSVIEAGGVKLEHIFIDTISAEYYGIKYDGSDETTVVQKLAAISSSKMLTILFQPKTVRISQLDLRGLNGVKFIGQEGNEYRKTAFQSIGSTSLSFLGESVFIMINDGVGSAVRETVFKHINVIEDSSTNIDIAFLAVNAPQSLIEDITFYGFGKQLKTSSIWNSEFSRTHHYHFRVKGVCFNEGNSNYASINGLMFNDLHFSSNIADSLCMDLQGVNSVNINNLTIEGSSKVFFKVGATTRSVVITNIHAESVKTFIELDVVTGSPTIPFGNITILGGSMFIAGSSEVATARFVRETPGSPANSVGLHTLTLEGVSIQKPTSNIVSEYFNMSKVANFKTTARFQPVTSDADINNMTWNRIGISVNESHAKTCFGHNGLTTGLRRAFYSGLVGENILARNSYSGTAMNTGVGIVALDKTLNNSDKGVVLDVEVIINYNQSAFLGRLFYAKFYLAITQNDTLIQKVVFSDDLYAVDTTFSYNSTTGVITATNTSLNNTSATFKFIIKYKYW